MPTYLQDTRKAVASALWLPFSYLVMVVVFAILLQTAETLFALGLDFPSAAAIFAGYLPGAAVVASAVAAWFLIQNWRGEGRSTAGLFLRAFFWCVSLPARGWFLGFGWVLIGVVKFVVFIVMGIMGLVVAWWLISLLQSFGVNGWVLALVGVLVCGLAVGGGAWANQYGSGQTQGFPIGLVVLAFLAFIGIVGWLILTVTIFAVLAIPFSLVLFAFQGGRWDPSWEWYELALALGAAVVVMGPPLITEGADRIKAAVSTFLDALPFVGRRRRAARAAATPRVPTLRERQQVRREEIQRIQREALDRRFAGLQNRTRGDAESVSRALRDLGGTPRSPRSDGAPRPQPRNLDGGTPNVRVNAAVNDAGEE